MRRTVLGAIVLTAVTLSASAAGASTSRSGLTQNVRTAQRSSQSDQARAACEADGATVQTAMAAFSAQNPGTVPTMGDLTSSANGGPYIQNAPFNPTYYKFSISHGVLKLAVVKTVSPHITYKDAVSYAGPSSCSGVRALPGSQKTAQAIASCEADGATVSTAIAAFDAQNPGTVPTMALLISSANGGPYISNAPHNPKYYKFSISHGVLKLAEVKSLGPPIAYTDPFTYAGPGSCVTI